MRKSLRQITNSPRRRILTGPTVDVRSGIHRVRQYVANRAEAGTAPGQLTLLETGILANRQFYSMPHEPPQQPGGRSEPLELFKDHPHHGTSLLVRLQLNFARTVSDVADGNLADQLAAASLLQCALEHSLLEDVQFRFGHRSLEAQQQSIVVDRRVV